MTNSVGTCQAPSKYDKVSLITECLVQICQMRSEHVKLGPNMSRLVQTCRAWCTHVNQVLSKHVKILPKTSILLESIRGHQGRLTKLQVVCPTPRETETHKKHPSDLRKQIPTVPGVVTWPNSRFSKRCLTVLVHLGRRTAYDKLSPRLRYALKVCCHSRRLLGQKKLRNY